MPDEFGCYEEELEWQESDFTDDLSVMDAFTNGDCWRLALSLNALAGFPILAVCSLDHPENTWCHVFNQLPDGSLIDITGIYSEAEMLDKWKIHVYQDNEGIAPLTREDLEGFEFYSDEDPDEWARFLLNEITPAASAA